jgi:hypothetical protein
MGHLTKGVFVCNITLIVLASFAIGCRIWRRLYFVGSLDGKDVLIIFAAICASAFSILMMVSTEWGLGDPVRTVPPEHFTPLLQIFLATEYIYFFCNWAIKHSLLAFYMDLTIPKVDRWARASIYAMHVVAFAFGCTCIGVITFQCHPIRAAWHIDMYDHCVNTLHFAYFNACFMLFTDLILYAMPLFLTRNLQLQRAQRIGVNFLFALGIIVLGASGARIWAVSKLGKDRDFTYILAAAMICAVIENQLAIIVACAPSIKVVMGKFCPNLSNKIKSWIGEDKGPELRSLSTTLDIESIGTTTTKRGSAGSKEMSRGMPCRWPSDESRRTWRSKRRWWRAPSNWLITPPEEAHPTTP